MIFKSKSFLMLVLGFALIAFGNANVIAAPGSVYGELVLSGGKLIPTRDNVSFIAYIDNDDSVIHTENAYNSPLGLKQGYTIYEGKGYWFVNFANFRRGMDGNPYTVIFTTLNNNQQAVYKGTIPSGYTNVSDQIMLKPTMAPLAPSNVTATWHGNQITVNWNTQTGLVYDVYRTDLPSGANNSAGNGIYSKVADNISGSFIDNNVVTGNDYWYIVIAENKAGSRSAHSNEVHAAPLKKMSPKRPMLEKQNNVLQPQTLEDNQIQQDNKVKRNLPNNIPASPVK